MFSVLDADVDHLAAANRIHVVLGAEASS